MRALMMAAVAMMVWRAAPASAAWQRATSDHFIVYADADAAPLRQRARELELFDAALRRFQHVDDSTDARHNKVTVFVLPTVEAVQKLLHADDIAGIYLPRVSGSVAFTPLKGDGRGKTALPPRVVLFHEYAHHFLLGSYPVAIPAWFSEGYAEFVSTAAIDASGVTIGLYPAHRTWGLLPENRVAAARLFAPPAEGIEGESFYARGWLLTHYIEFDPARRRQFGRYLEMLNHGTPSLAAARQAFGDLAALDTELARYVKQPTLPATVIRAASLGDPAVDISLVSDGVAALMPLRMQSALGLDKRAAAGLLAKAKPVAALYPADPVVQGWLAEMAYDAGDDAAALQAAEAALAVARTDSQALLYKARVLLRRAKDGKADAAGWTAARQPIIAANRADHDDPAALALFYQSFADQGVRPTPGAVAGLYRAAVLAPQDRTVRMAAARQHLIDGDAEQARELLRTLAYDPHAGRGSAAAKLLAILDAGVTGQAALDALDGKTPH